jgi:thiamine pyrophosphate-dependent acetolactate synthase large subunit-like protein
MLAICLMWVFRGDSYIKKDNIYGETVAKIIVNVLEKGVECILNLPEDDHILSFFIIFYDSIVKTILVRNKQYGGYKADDYVKK